MASNGYGSSRSSAWILPIKAVAASAVVLSTAVVLQISSPSILRFVSSEVPRIYGSLISWLTPPYLYFVINGIIISIAASSRFHKSAAEDLDLIGSGSASVQPVVKQEFAVPPPAYEAKVEEEVRAEYVIPAAYETVVEDDARVSKGSEVKTVAAAAEDGEREDFVISRSSWTPKRTESTENLTEYSFLTEKPLVSSRLGRRKSLKASPEAGKALGVSRPKRNETLENTWKAITDGRAVPLTRHLKKSDTWEVHHSRREEPSSSPLMRKSETFNERGARRPPVASPSSQSPSPAAASKLRKEPSVGQDDLNRRVEAFIKKFNEEMRLQRQESLKHYMDMVNRGSH